MSTRSTSAPRAPLAGPGTSLSPAVVAALAVALLVLGGASYAYLVGRGEDRATLRIATGPAGGVYAMLGERLETILERELPVEVTVRRTAGSLENVGLIGEGEVELAFMQSDTEPGETVRCVASLYEELLHIVVHGGDGRPATLFDLRGARLALGAQGSGTQAASLRLLEHFWLRPGVDFELVDLAPKEAVAAFRERAVDALFLFAAAPSSQLRRLLVDTDAELMPLSFHDVEAPGGAATDGVEAAIPSLHDALLPSYTYGTKPTRPVLTVGVSGLLTAARDLDVDLVRDVTRVLFAHRRALADVHPALATMPEGIVVGRSPVPYHDGARRWFDRDQPHFVVEYAEAISLGLTFLVGAYSGFIALRQWLKSRRKNRIDVYYLRVHELASRISDAAPDELDSLRRDLIDVRLQAFDDLVRERIDADSSFIIFHDFLRDELRGVEDRLHASGRARA